MKKKYQFITIGGATRDFMFYDPAAKFLFTPENLIRQKSLCFEYGAKIQVGKTYFTFGGGGANTAVNFSNLGFKTAALVALGDDENGQAVLTNFKKQGVDTRLIQIQPGKMTGFSFILTAGKEKEHVIFLYRGANNNLSCSLGNLKKLKTRWFYVTSLSNSNWQQILDNVFLKQKSLLAWNPGGQQLQAGWRGLHKYLAVVNVLALNKDEAIELVSSVPEYKKSKSLNNVKYLLRKIRKMGPEIVLITSGRAGADVYDGRNFYHQKVVGNIKKVVDTTGVGDCFNSTFVAGLEKFNGDIKKAMLAAAKNSAAITTKVGAQNGLKKVI